MWMRILLDRHSRSFSNHFNPLISLLSQNSVSSSLQYFPFIRILCQQTAQDRASRVKTDAAALLPAVPLQLSLLLLPLLLGRLLRRCAAADAATAAMMCRCCRCCRTCTAVAAKINAYLLLKSHDIWKRDCCVWDVLFCYDEWEKTKNKKCNRNWSTSVNGTHKLLRNMKFDVFLLLRKHGSFSAILVLQLYHLNCNCDISFC